MKKSIAIVTGASSGFGKEFVKLLCRKDLDEIWAIARDETKLKALQEDMSNLGRDIEVKNETDVTDEPIIRIFPMDLTDRRNFDLIRENLRMENVSVKYLINNAGFAKFCSYDDIDVDESINMIDLNINAVVAMGLIAIPHMERGSKILNIASQASFQPLPYQNIYSSTKAFVRNYTRALNVELRDRSITATAVCPGWMKTGLFDRGIVNARKATRHFNGMVSPDVAAAKAMRDADKGKDISVYSLYVKVGHLLAKILPQRVMMKVWLMQQKLK